MNEHFSTPIVRNSIRGRVYSNPSSFGSFIRIPSLIDLIWSRFRDADRSAIPSTQVLDETLPIIEPQFPKSDSSLAATWLGHATLLIRLDDISIITDPVWASRATPFGLRMFGCRRYRSPPCEINKLPKIDVGIISHNHYDHLDEVAVRKISSKCPNMVWFVPTGLKDWMIKVTQSGTVYELCWGQKETVWIDDKSYDIWCIPAQHWSQRGVFNRNKSLWCGWAIVGPENKFYYTGDTGFCEEEFRKLGQQLGPFDLCAIPIGCYEPRWIMESQHIGPLEAVSIHRLVKSIKSIGVHWGTYKMFFSCESYLDPRSMLREQIEKANLPQNSFITLEHGETWSKN